MATKISRPKNFTWLITGCSSGFGLSFARIAQANGHIVIATSRSPSRTPDLLDVDDPDCGCVITRLEEQGTVVDVLINCAGFSISGPVESFRENEVHQLMETNFFGPYRLIRAVVPYMRQRRSGVIVNISSGSGLEARQSLVVYGASKAALDNLTKTLYKELKDFNIRVLLVSLGTFDMPMISPVRKVSKPIDPDYQETMTQKNMDILHTGNFTAGGDHLKAVKVIYEMIMGEGVGKGLKAEMMIPLGADMAVRANETRDKVNHMMEVFGDICNNVNVETESK